MRATDLFDSIVAYTTSVTDFFNTIGQNLPTPPALECLLSPEADIRAQNVAQYGHPARRLRSAISRAIASLPSSTRAPGTPSRARYSWT